MILHGHHCVLSGLALALGMVCGCGGGDEKPQLAPVTGKAVLAGQPIAGATVVFYPDQTQKTKGPASSGRTNEQGQFTLYAPDMREGAVVGHHIVTVTPPMDLGNLSSPTGDPNAPKPPKPIDIPTRYTDLNSTNLKAEVKSADTNDLTLELTK